MLEVKLQTMRVNMDSSLSETVSVYFLNINGAQEKLGTLETLLFKYDFSV